MKLPEEPTRFWHHQTVAFKYTLKHQHPALFMEMRMGKTLVAIRRIQMYKPLSRKLKVLIVTTYSAFSGWNETLQGEQEFDRIKIVGTRKQRLDNLRVDMKWSIINWQGFLVVPEIATLPWDVVVLDESPFIKNPRTLVSRFYTKNFKAVPHRWILTGTPAPESPLNYFQQMLFLDNGETLQSENYWKFRMKHFRPIFHDWKPTLRGRRFIRKQLAERVVFMTRKDFKLGPKKIYKTRTLDFPQKIKTIYKTAVEEFILEDGKMELKTNYAMVKFNWLRKLCSGLIEDRHEWDGKASELHYLISSELKDQKIVVFCDYVLEVNTLVKFLKKKRTLGIEWVHGKVKQIRRDEIVKRFEHGGCRIIVAQPDCFTYGADLSAADTVIYYSTPLKNITRKQTEDRIVSVENKTPVLVIDLVVKDSIEEDILKSYRDKMSDASRMESIIKKLQSQHAKAA